MIVCHCRVLSDRDVKTAVREGAVDARTVLERRAAAGCCGSCTPTIQRIVALESLRVRGAARERPQE